MEISKLFEILAEYLNFLIDFGMLRGFEKYTRLGSISPELVTYFVAGVFIAYVISSIKRVPGYERIVATQPEPASLEAETSNPKSDDNLKMDMAGFILLSITGALLFHAFLVGYHKIFSGTEIGNVKDSFNAVFAANAIYHPINAALKQVQRGAKQLAEASTSLSVIGSALYLIISALYFATTYYFIFAFARTHGTSLKYQLGMMVAFTLVLTIAVFAVTFVITFIASRAPRPKQ